MNIKRIRSVDLPDEVQLYIRATCLSYRWQPQRVRQKIERSCRACGGEHAQALLEMMTTRRPVHAIAAEHYVSERALYDMRRAFCLAWGRELVKNRETFR